MGLRIYALKMSTFLDNLLQKVNLRKNKIIYTNAKIYTSSVLSSYRPKQVFMAETEFRLPLEFRPKSTH